MEKAPAYPLGPKPYLPGIHTRTPLRASADVVEPMFWTISPPEASALMTPVVEPPLSVQTGAMVSIVGLSPSGMENGHFVDSHEPEPAVAT